MSATGLTPESGGLVQGICGVLPVLDFAPLATMCWIHWAGLTGRTQGTRSVLYARTPCPLLTSLIKTPCSHPDHALTLSSRSKACATHFKWEHLGMCLNTRLSVSFLTMSEGEFPGLGARRKPGMVSVGNSRLFRMRRKAGRLLGPEDTEKAVEMPQT